MKKIIIDGFNNIEKKPEEKPQVAKDELRKLKGNQKGKGFKCRDYKALRIVIKEKNKDGADEIVIKESEFSKLFPNEFGNFNIKSLKVFGEAKGYKGNIFTIETSLYFPLTMLEAFKVDVYFRQKNKLIHYDLNATPEKDEQTFDDEETLLDDAQDTEEAIPGENNKRKSKNK